MPPSSPKNSLFKLGLVQRKTAETTAAELEAASKARAEKERRDLAAQFNEVLPSPLAQHAARATGKKKLSMNADAIGIGSGISLR